MNSHLTILHLFANTVDDKINRVASIRHENLLEELELQKITDYTIFPGYYDKENTKQAIHVGHRHIVQLARDQGMNECVIAEDDIVFTAPGAWQYFLSQIPQDYDLFCGCIFAGEVDPDNRILNGMSATMTLYSIHSRFYDTFLDQPVNSHIDRQLGGLSWKYKYYVVSPQVVVQRGGKSYNLGCRPMFYHVYMEGKKYYGREEGLVYREGIWQTKSN